MSERAQAPLLLYVVEDDARTRQELERILARHTDLEVRSFESPLQALSQLDSARPDLALIDLRLPQMDGLALLERVSERVPDVMAIVMTGYGEAETPRRARERGAVDFVQKPLDLPYLLVALRQLARECRLRKDLRDSAALFARVLEMTPDGLLLADAAGGVLFANSLGRGLFDAGATEPGESREREGKTYVLDKHTSGERTLWHWADLTHALERERFGAYRQMARFLAHELRNPLTPMRLWLQELESTPHSDPRYGELAAQAVSVLLGQVDRLVDLLERFRTLGEAPPLSLASVEVGRVARETARALAPLAAQRGVEVSVPQEGEWFVRADAGMLHQLLFNLLRNALESEVRPGSPVRVTVAESEGGVLVEVADEGGGLPPEVAAAPFTPYLTTKTGGTGLGLLICQELAERMGGRLELANREGQGVTARVRLARAP